MTYDEFQTVLKKIYASFPGIYEWLKRNSPDAAATHKTWFRSVEQCTVKECEAVLDSWIDGRRPPPSYQEQTQLGLTLRSCVMFDRPKSEHKVLQEVREYRRPDYKPILPVFVKCAEWERMKREGELPAEDADRLINNAIKSLED